MSFRTIASSVAAAALLVVSAFAASVDGKWVGKSGGQDVTLEFKANNEALSGTMNGAAIENGKVDGDSISFTAGNAKYEGRVAGDELHITRTVEGEPPTTLTAKRAGSTT